MRNLNENNITDAVIARFQGCDDPNDSHYPHLRAMADEIARVEDGVIDLGGSTHALRLPEFARSGKREPGLVGV